MRLLVYGWYNHGNIGDESYKLSFPQIFSEHDLRFTDDPGTIDPGSYDVLVVGGGNILNQHHVGKLVRMKASGVLIHPVIGFSLGFTDEGVTSGDLGLFSKIVVRDRGAYERLCKMGVSGAALAPDAAFCLNPDRERGLRIWEGYYQYYHRDLYERRVVVVLNSHLCSGHESLSRDTLRFLTFSNSMAEIIDRTNASVLFVPFGTTLPWADRIANGCCASKCKWFKKNLVLYDDLGVQSVLDVVAAADAVVSMRLHASIFSAVANVPFLDIYHHDKNLWNLQTLGLEDWGVPYWDFAQGRAKCLLEDHLNAPGVGRGRLERIREAQRVQLRGGVDGIYFGEQT